MTNNKRERKKKKRKEKEGGKKTGKDDREKKEGNQPRVDHKIIRSVPLRSNRLVSNRKRRTSRLYIVTLLI